MMVKYFGRLCIDNVWLDISAYPKKGYEVKEIEIKFWNGHVVHIQSLKECLDTYKSTGNKTNYVAEIESFLAIM